jgi:hypothetical protein
MADDRELPELFRVIEHDTMTGWDEYLNNMGSSPWTGTFTREQAEACVDWREKNIARRYRYEIVPAQPYMTDAAAARERHDDRDGRHSRQPMKECADIDCREASARLAREEIGRQFAAKDTGEAAGRD